MRLLELIFQFLPVLFGPLFIGNIFDGSEAGCFSPKGKGSYVQVDRQPGGSILVENIKLIFAFYCFTGLSPAVAISREQAVFRSNQRQEFQLRHLLD